MKSDEPFSGVSERVSRVSERDAIILKTKREIRGLIDQLGLIGARLSALYDVTPGVQDYAVERPRRAAKIARRRAPRNGGKVLSDRQRSTVIKEVREVMNRRGWFQKDLAEAADVPVYTITALTRNTKYTQAWTPELLKLNAFVQKELSRKR